MADSQRVQEVMVQDAQGQNAPLSVSESTRHAMLLDFLHRFDAPCPICGYNLKALTKPICPECGQTLQLTVGIWGERLRLGWLFVALAPGFFSGICAGFLLVAILAQLIFGDGRTSIGINIVDLFGWISGIFAIWLAANRNKFIALSRSKQRWIALLLWFIHIFAFVMMLTLGPKYF